MPTILIKKLAGWEPEKEELEEALQRIVKSSNQNFENIRNLLYGNVDFMNVDSSGIMQTWQDSSEDNVDEEHPMSVDIYMPPETERIHKVILRLRLKEFRAYSRAAETEPEIGTSTEGGGAVEQTTDAETLDETSGPSSVSTTEDGGADERTSADGIWTFFSERLPGAVSEQADHNHGIPDNTGIEDIDGNVHWFSELGTHTHALDYKHDHEVEIQDHYHGMSHTHLVEGNHSHWVTIDPHSHDFVIPEHDHDLIHGIYVDPFPTDPTVTVEINDQDVTSELGGPFHISEPSLDITEWIEKGQWNTIKLGTDNDVLLRLQATVFVQAFIAPVDRLDPEER